MSIKDKDTMWLLASVIVIILLATAGANYDKFKFSDWQNFFNVKTYPKDDKPKENDFDKLFR
jgi:hypothetical protein